MIKNKQGFGLLEVIVAVGILSVVSMGVMRTTQNASQVTNYLETKIEELELTNSIQMHTMNKRSCTHTLGGYCSNRSIVSQFDCVSAGQTWTNGFSLPNDSVTKAAIPAIFNHRGSDVYRVGEKYGLKIQIESIELRNKAVADGGVDSVGGIGTAELIITLKRLSKVRVGTDESVKIIPVMVKTAGALPSRIMTCMTAEDMDIIPKDKTYLVTKIGNTSQQDCFLSRPGDADHPRIEPNCKSYRASCDTGDQALAGDCLISPNNARNVVGDLTLLIPSGTDCSSCPNNDPAVCPLICVDGEYTGYECLYYGAVTTATSGARILCLDRTF